MRIAKFAVTALLSVAALCVATVTAHGEPLAGPGIVGVDRGVEYTTTLAADRGSVTTTLTSGHFALAENAVTVIASSGEAIGAIPLVYYAADRVYEVIPSLDASGTVLTVTPASTTDVAAPSVNTVALQQVADAGSIVAGALIGCVVGAVIGFFFFFVGAIIGCGVGGLLGAIIAGQR
ncbi:hypothetical protein [Nocardia huaxiensis]|uniref:DUF8020 domain-containing protein n=1 Tax=Nocardia huaxiensis TaxID=2755382 RepID=A0A7D6V5G5_9NOCA|nr:hypothetical protein [Nocardia huaxiensis]QLY27912.1 hypothetical protein H0264_21010 [Nocardia huaxiensis]UFS98683.1 hypothetical protein LPY97_12685 [Nocardia huaxiensis]